MVQLKAYHRPPNIEEAIRLLSRPDVNSAILAGGTYLNADMDELVDEVIDLQAVGLDQITCAGDCLTLGAMVRLQTIVDNKLVPTLLREMARRAGPNTLRNEATIGGVVVGANAESELLAALLVCEAEVEVQSASSTRRVALSDFLVDVPAALEDGLVTAISLTTSGTGAGERVARTPADRPIVAAIGRLAEGGQLHLALCGVAPTPILVGPELDQLKASLNPPGDFRGSSEYRRQMAVTLSKRVVAALQGEG